MFLNLNLLQRQLHVYKPILHPYDDCTNEELIRRFRSDRNGIDYYLSNCLRVDLERVTEKNRPIPVEIAVMAALRYLATADRQLDVADTLNISQPTVSRIVATFFTSINQKIG